MARNGRKIIGGTGTNRLPLSDEALQYKLSVGRTVRYQYLRLGPKCWIAWVCAPFHSRTYGLCGFGTTKYRAKDVLQTNLANNFGYIGRLILSNVDESDTVGDRYYGYNDGTIKDAPITVLG